MFDIDVTEVKTPCYIVDKRRLQENLELLKSIIDRTGCKILLAQKAFSMFHLYPMIGEYLCGTTASSLFEARLGYEEMGKETHIYTPAYQPGDFKEIVKICDHIVFNHLGQWETFKDQVRQSGRAISCGIRINPEYSEVETDLYNPCFKYSRLGTIKSQIEGKNLDGIEGFHFHTMCEQNSDVLKRTLDVVEERFGEYFPQLKWLNFGGGHHITRKDYDVDTLISCINRIQDKYHLQVYLEPGEAVALNAGYLVSTVLDVNYNDMNLAILDTSAACHMPDVLEMPYRPEVIGAGKPNEKAYTYRFGGPTCLSGDIIGDYSFDHPLKPGDKIVFCDMAIYSMVKNNTFNGINLPDIVTYDISGKIEVIKQFCYNDFKTRLS